MSIFAGALWVFIVSVVSRLFGSAVPTGFLLLLWVIVFAVTMLLLAAARAAGKADEHMGIK